MKAHSAEHLDDEQALLVLSDALMEQGDPQGRLIAFMLEEERGTELMRKVKVNVLIRDHAAQWAPAGAKITAFHRGLPTELEWFGATDPHHVSWRSARAIACSLETVPSPSVFEVIRPQLERVSGLNRALLAHVLVAAPPQLASLDVLLFNEAQAEAITRTRARLPALNRLTLRTTLAPLDDSLRDGRLRMVMEASRGLRGVRLSMPRLSLALIDECLALAPKLDLQFVIPWRDVLQDAQIPLVVDPRRRLLHVPQSLWFDTQLRDFLATLYGLLGEELQVVRD
jgi:hypothetical protein